MAPSEENQYRLLTQFEDYQQCIAKASQIQHIKHKEKEADRIKGLLTAKRELARLNQATQDSEHPLLLYYHWSRNNNDAALDKLLAMEGGQTLQTPELQLALASYYVKFDLDKTQQHLYRALELQPADSEVNPEIFRGLMNIFMKRQDFAQAYVWGQIAREFDVADIDLGQVESVLLQQKASLRQLRRQADDLAESIEEGHFKMPTQS